MARSAAIHTVDDITGEPARETVFFALDGIAYEIDLTAEHADRLRDVLLRYAAHARRTGGRRRKRTLVDGPTPLRRATTPRAPRPVSRRRNPEPAHGRSSTVTQHAPREQNTQPATQVLRRPVSSATVPVRPDPIPEVRFSAPAS
ncbi:histone-like nucleoid-structuring protein Lsr2 [Saccharomonospora xinjiangensis]|uniref:Lsr2 dimerization domain-containing protein n=1 Tax=Saccharomonospora xinjiangensis TaxID=75294 RepID=UPI0010C4A021|nr:histone-like nucleoid-structuring protein Lsr2 [Saccharomonospora xinjiangensis]QBQ59483.1 Nucleoid-associated protein Lsr2 [Saccharomonospora xinjiangensis]